MAKNPSYKRLGDFIRQVDIRNRDLTVDNLLGLSNTKDFIPSIANTIGTDLSRYKIVTPRQFAYVPITSRNGDRITIALYSGKRACIISQAYTVFEVRDFNTLLPEYLMMWFRRPEFDRYARFKSHGSAREVFDWDEMCEVLLPVPPIEEQHKIVAEYQTVERRIENNRRLAATLEATAQSIYRHLFADDIDPENLPDGWRTGSILDIMNIGSGKTIADKTDTPDEHHVIPVAGASGIIGYATAPNQESRVITTGRVGTLGVVNKYMNPIWTADNVLVAKSDYFNFAYHTLLGVNYKEIASGGVQSLITQTGLLNYPQIIPPVWLIESFEGTVEPISNLIYTLGLEIETNKKLQSLLLTKLSRL